MASSREVIAFRLNYAEFKGLSDPDIAAAFDDADVWLDASQWSPRDYPTARALWVGHNLNILAQLLANIETMGPLLGFTDQTLGTVSFGERRVAFKQMKDQSGKGGKPSPGDVLKETWYGRQFILLRSRNIIPIMTV